MITAEQFEQATGYAPQGDDLERCNCRKAGQFGHLTCGWNSKTNLPIFISWEKPNDQCGTEKPAV
jgi:hypothetical protein